MKRRTFLRGAPAAIAGVYAGCNREAPGGRRVLNVGITTRTSMSPLFVARERGYFDEVGLEVEPHQVSASPQMIPLTAGGELDACLPSINVAFVNAVARGARLSITASRQSLRGACGDSAAIHGHKDAFPDGLEDVRPLRGKRIAIGGTHTFTEFTLDVLLRSGGMTLDDIDLVTLKQDESVAALLAGRIDALVTTFIAVDPETISSNFVKGPTLADLLPDLQRGFIAFGPTLLDDSVEVGAAFLEAYLRGVADFMGGYFPAFFDELAIGGGEDPQIARERCHDMMIKDGAIDRDSIQMYVDWSARRGYSPDPPAVEQLIDERFLRRAHERLAGDV